MSWVLRSGYLSHRASWIFPPGSQLWEGKSDLGVPSISCPNLHFNMAGLVINTLLTWGKQIHPHSKHPSGSPFPATSQQLGAPGWGWDIEACVKGTLGLLTGTALSPHWKGLISHVNGEEPLTVQLNYLSLLSLRLRVHMKFTLLLQRLRIIRRH